MFEIIASKDYRNFMAKEGIELTDWDKATLIYNHPTATCEEKAWALIDIKRNTKDEELIKQIDERLARDTACYKRFKENNGNAYYVLSIFYERKYEEEASYLSYGAAYEDGKKGKLNFRITKILFKCKEDEGQADGVFGSVEYDGNGCRKNILYFYTVNNADYLEQPEYMRFEYRYPGLPLMFRQQDIVHVIGTELYGIVDSPVDDEKESLYRELRGQSNIHYSDFQVPVNLMYNKQNFLAASTHEHYAPTELEFVDLDDDDIRKGFLEYMRETLYGKSLFYGKGRNSKRIGSILSKLEAVWRQYPDLRLGQLIIAVCGKKNLFALEDEILMERLQKNEFPVE